MNGSLSVGIITMHRVTNFGSALQVYGLFQTIQNLGYNTHIIDYRFPNSFQKRHNKKKGLPILFKQRNLFKTVSYKISSKIFKVWEQQRLLFEDFYRDRLLLTQPYLEREDIIANPPNFDIVITGSDQVWNTKHTFGDPTFFCDFAGNCPRISFGASFSTSELDSNYKEGFKHLLNNYVSISVREQNGVRLVKELTGKEAKVVCDPSMLLTKESYRQLSNKSKLKIDKPYILAYILDYNFNPYPLIENLLNKISREKKLDIIYLQCGSIHGNTCKGNKQVFDAGPLEFLWLIDNAEIIVTSSFHGAAFSIIFEKDFYAVYDNNSKDDRLTSLCQTLNLESRLLSRNQDINNIIDQPIDWHVTNDKLSTFRNQSLSFLKNSLEKCLKNI